MRIILLGPPGAGKGSLAKCFERRLGVEHISTGEIFRKEIARGTVLGRRVQRIVRKGTLVPNAVVVEVMVKRLGRVGRGKGYILDGFPRTVGQARALDKLVRKSDKPLDGAVYLTSPQAVLVRRLSGRRVCDRCGANYHVRTMQPRRAGRCDRCEGRLITRHDDRPATVKRRLAIDRVRSAPLMRYYDRQGKLHRVNGAGMIDKVFVRALARCRREGWLRTGRSRSVNDG